MGGLGALGGRRLLTDAADAAVAASRKRADVDLMTLEELEQDIDRFAHDCPRVGHAELFAQVWDDWQQVERLLDARQNLKGRAHLTLLGGQLTYFLARLSVNLGDYAAARRQAVLAWQYAEDVGQPVLGASVRTLQGTIAFDAGQPEKALELLRAAEPSNPPTAARGSRPMRLGPMRCRVTGPGQNTRSRRWSAISWTCPSSRAVRPPRRRRQRPPWRAPSHASVLVRPPRRTLAKRSPCTAQRGSRTPSSRTEATPP